MIIASFDIGKKTYSFYVEKYEEKELDGIEWSDECRYNKDGTPTSDFASVLDQVYMTGECLELVTRDLTKGCTDASDLVQVCQSMTRVLDEYAEYWSTCDVVLVEQQMSFRGIYNTTALKLGQHCMSYFLVKYPSIRVVEFPAYHKTMVLGAERTLTSTLKRAKPVYKCMDKVSRKKWTSNLALEILEMRGDTLGMVKLLVTTKTNDRADCVCQAQAYKVLTHVPTHIPTQKLTRK